MAKNQLNIPTILPIVEGLPISAKELVEKSPIAETAVKSASGYKLDQDDDKKKPSALPKTTLSAYEWLTEKEVAVILRISVSSLQKWRLYGGGPPFTRISRNIRYSARLLEKFLMESTFSSTSEADARA